MKRIIFLLLGILTFSLACQKEVVEPENEPGSNLKSAKFEKTKTFYVRSHVEATPDPGSQFTVCTPAEYEIALPGSGWVGGHKNMFGKFVLEESSFERDYCELQLTAEGPVVYSHANVEITGASGDKIFVESHTWINVTTGALSGYNEIKDGTGRFEGAYGEADMLNATLDPVTGIAEWDEEGYITMVIK